MKSEEQIEEVKKNIIIAGVSSDIGLALAKDWINKNWNNGENGFIEWEKDSMTRLVTYLREIEEGHRHTSSKESRERDFKSFYTQYDIRRNKNFIETFPELEDWFDMVRESRTDYVQEIKKVRGDENNLYKLDYEKRALEEGIVTDDLENEIIKHLENE
jgi:hypothetical protein